MQSVIVVTGATGNVGKQLAQDLLARGVQVRAIGRSAERLRPLSTRGAEAAVGSVGDEAFLTQAFRGAAAVFAMVPPDLEAPDARAHQRRIADVLGKAIAAAGVSRVVSLSSVGAHLPSGTGPIAGLHDFEEVLNGVRGLDLVHLRPAYFMENHLASIGLIKTAGISGSAIRGDLPMPMIATRDIAAAAADLLARRSFSGGSTRELLGPRDYTQAQAATILGRALGKDDLRYVQFPYEEARKAMVQMGLSPSMADAYVEMSRAFNDGLVRPLEPRSPANTTPTSLEEFAKTFAAAYRAS